MNRLNRSAAGRQRGSQIAAYAVIVVCIAIFIGFGILMLGKPAPPQPDASGPLPAAKGKAPAGKAPVAATPAADDDVSTHSVNGGGVFK